METVAFLNMLNLCKMCPGFSGSGARLVQAEASVILQTLD